MNTQKWENLISLVKIIICEEMMEFKRLGRLAKELQEKGEPIEKIQFIHLEMADIFHGLIYFEKQVRELYPTFSDLFDRLIILRKEHESLLVLRSYTSEGGSDISIKGKKKAWKNKNRD